MLRSIGWSERTSREARDERVVYVTWFVGKVVVFLLKVTCMYSIDAVRGVCVQMRLVCAFLIKIFSL